MHTINLADADRRLSRLAHVAARATGRLRLLEPCLAAAAACGEARELPAEGQVARWRAVLDEPGRTVWREASEEG